MHREIVPLDDYIILLPPDRDGSRIVVPEQHKNNVNVIGVGELEVAMVGPNCKTVQIGDHLVVDPAGVPMFAHEGKNYFITREKLVGAILRKAPVPMPKKSGQNMPN